MLLIHTYNGMFEKIIGKFGDELMKNERDRWYYKSNMHCKVLKISLEVKLSTTRLFWHTKYTMYR